MITSQFSLCKDKAGLDLAKVPATPYPYWQVNFPILINTLPRGHWLCPNLRQSAPAIL